MSFGSAKIDGPPSMSRNRIGRWKSKRSSRGSSRWNAATSCLRNRKWSKQRRKRRGLHEQIRDDDDQGPLVDRFGQFVQHRHQLRLPGRPRLFQNVEDMHQVGRIAARRNVLDQPSATQYKPTASPCCTAR